MSLSTRETGDIPPVPPVPHARDESVAVSDRLDMKRDNVGAGVDYRRHLFAQSAEIARKNRRRNLNFRHSEHYSRFRLRIRRQSANNGRHTDGLDTHSIRNRAIERVAFGLRRL